MAQYASFFARNYRRVMIMGHYTAIHSWVGILGILVEREREREREREFYSQLHCRHTRRVCLQCIRWREVWAAGRAMGGAAAENLPWLVDKLSIASKPPCLSPACIAMECSYKDTECLGLYWRIENSVKIKLLNSVIWCQVHTSDTTCITHESIVSKKNII